MIMITKVLTRMFEQYSRTLAATRKTNPLRRSILNEIRRIIPHAKSSIRESISEDALHLIHGREMGLEEAVHVAIERRVSINPY